MSVAGQLDRAANARTDRAQRRLVPGHLRSATLYRQRNQTAPEQMGLARRRGQRFPGRDLRGNPVMSPAQCRKWIDQRAASLPGSPVSWADSSAQGERCGYSWTQRPRTTRQKSTKPKRRLERTYSACACRADLTGGMDAKPAHSLPLSVTAGLDMCQKPQIRKNW